MASQIQVRRDSAANWTTTNPVLAQGEPGYETDTGKLKYGDGTSTWSALPYSAAPDNFDLDAVTTNGNTTTNSITVGAATLTGDLAVDTDTLFVDVSTDRVGIGTSNPSDLLDISANGTSAMRLTDSSSPATYAQFTQANGVLTLAADAGNAQGASNIQFEVDGSEALRITDSGNVGIGITDPSRKLSAKSSQQVVASFESESTTTGGISLLDGNTTDDSAVRLSAVSDSLSIYTGGSETVRVTSGGNVGIGTDSPNRHLDIEDLTNTPFMSLVGNATSVPGILFGDTGSDAIGQIRYFNTDNSMEFTAGNNMGLRIQADGNVGIGADSPASLVAGGSSPVLSIGGTDVALTTGEKSGSLSFITSDPSYTTTYSDGITGEIVSVAETGVGGGYGLAFYTGVTTDTDRDERVRIDMRGNLGVGTPSPSAKLQVADGATDRISMDVSGVVSTLKLGSVNTGAGNFVASYDRSTGRLTASIGVNGSENDAFSIAADGAVTFDGNLGIGVDTASPTELLLAESPSDTEASFLIRAGATATSSLVDASLKLFARSSNNAQARTRITAVGTGGQSSHLTFNTEFGGSLTEKVRIEAGGNVGIGTDAPSTILHLAEDNPLLRFEDTAGGTPYTFDVGSDAGLFKVINATSTTTPFVIEGATGDVGIGTSNPAANLEVSSDASTKVRISDSTNVNQRFEISHNAGFTALTAGNNAAKGILAFYQYDGTTTTEAMRIDQVGRVGIGINDPNYKLEWDGTARFTNNNYIRQIDSAGASPRILGMNSSNDTYVGPVDSYAGGSVLYGASGNVDSQFMYRLGQIAYSINTSGNHIWYKPGGSQGMIMLNDGNVLINKTVKQTQTQGLDVQQLNASDTDAALGLKSGTSTTTGNAFINCFLQSGVGSGRIEANGANSLGFGTFSDRNLKENIEDLPSQLGNIMQLRPVEFDYKDGAGHQIGFIAQEVEEVWPDLVSGEEGSKSVVGLGKTESRLIKALQEAVTKIEALEARIAVLESN